MSRSTLKPLPDDFPEFAVKRDVISAMFSPSLPRSTFYDRVKEGKIVPMKEVSGYFLLNASLLRLGLAMRRELPVAVDSRGLEDITRLAFTLIDPFSFPAPPWMLTVDAVEARDLNHATLIADQHRAEVEALDHVHLKLAYFGGVLDVAMLEERDQRGAAG